MGQNLYLVGAKLVYNLIQRVERYFYSLGCLFCPGRIESEPSRSHVTSCQGIDFSDDGDGLTVPSRAQTSSLWVLPMPLRVFAVSPREAMDGTTCSNGGDPAASGRVWLNCSTKSNV